SPVLSTAVDAPFVLKNGKHGAVKLFCLRDAHSMELEANDAETGTRKNFDNATRPQVWEFEIVRLNQDECLLGFCITWKRNDLIQDSPVRIGKFRPEFQIAFDSFGIKSRQYSGLEVSYLSRIVGDVLAVSISNLLPAGARLQAITHSEMN